MKLVSVIIPTHNRTELLIEAIMSVEAQSYRQIEIIVVDDASDTPLGELFLQKYTTFPLKLLRNNESESSIWCRDKGVNASTGEIVINLDDDDLLAPNAVSMVAEEFSDGALDKIVFLGVSGFGKKANDFDRIQASAVKKAIKGGGGKRLSNGKVKFSRELLAYLLGAVPSAFQRVAITRENWFKVTELRNRVYLNDPLINEDALKKIIQPPLRDSEWSIYAVALFDSVLLNNGLYLFRCDGQSKVSIPEFQRQSMISQKATLLNIYQNSRSFEVFKNNRKKIKIELANCYFSLAYYDYKNGDSRYVFGLLWKSFSLSIKLRCIKLSFKLFGRFFLANFNIDKAFFN